MKKSNALLILVIGALLFTLTSCSKKHDPKPASSNGVAGYWFGSANGGAFNQSFLLRTDGTLKVYDFYSNPTSTDTTKAYAGTGTYIVKDNLITINTYFPDGQSFSATAQLNLSANPPTITFGSGAEGYNGDVYRKQ